VTSDPSRAGGEDGEPFLSRWSRRKVAARTDVATPAPTLPAAAAENAIAPAAPAPTDRPTPTSVADRDAAGSSDPNATRPLPDLDSLSGIASDYRDFMQPGVDETTKRAALRKLFADPHFNRMDGLDVYIDDYGVPDPLPPAMLAALAVTKRLIVDPAAETPEAFARRRPEAAVQGGEDAAREAPTGAAEEERAEPAVSTDDAEALPPSPATVASTTLPPSLDASTNLPISPDASPRTKPE
jgi:hypothetical protein